MLLVNHVLRVICYRYWTFAFALSMLKFYSRHIETAVAVGIITMCYLLAQWIRKEEESD